MLAERVPHLPYLFHKCLISTDDILDQVVRNQTPKYDFESGFFASDDLLRIGIVREDVPVDTYAEARKILLDVVAREGFGLLVVDVFYLKHCPEHFTRHITHTITFTGYEPTTGEWSIVDDNPASVLCRYTYPDEVIAASYDNGALRRVRYFSRQAVDEAGLADGFAADFRDLLGRHQDSLALFSGAADILTCSWIARDKVIAMLHDAFSLYQGSRTGLLEYVTHAIGDAEAAVAIGRAVKLAADVQSLLLLGKVMGGVDTGAIDSLCAMVETAEEELIQRLRAAVAPG
jgi:hypothetical protein